ncbi:rod shape-determining protein MreC [Candidatus Deianiraea vastatrix]|uniref:Cell shape-determining protein MreC n=1 Tax=Candidatus Deianiraea vastatrix TaxID=2163644 RepID=A0A5B8XEV9_9RICK|nr:rod shape-determining protein MreC [Candidatus Deianiraea vastatrix]QED22871.1 Rod shape-determining protein MreC [Candidatus Deianiraea vastatrix]
MKKFRNFEEHEIGLINIINLGILNKYVNRIRYIFGCIYGISAIYFSINYTQNRDIIAMSITTKMNSLVTFFQFPMYAIRSTFNLVEDIFLVYHDNIILRENNQKLRENLIYQKMIYDNLITSSKLSQVNIKISDSIKNYQIAYFSEASNVVILKTGTDQIKDYSPVLCNGGLAGRTISSFNGMTKVVLIQSSKSYIPVSTSITGTKGVASGNDSNIKMIYTNETPKSGEIVYTMSGDNLFYSGIPIGIISKVVDNETIFIEPYCNISKLNQLSVITGSK